MNIEMSALLEALKRVDELQSNWASLRDRLQLTIDLYGDDEDIDTSVAEQVLDEMNVIERGEG